MLKIKFWKLENVVCMKILEQTENLIGTFANDEISSVSLHAEYEPEIYNENSIYLRGTNNNNDNKVSCYEFYTAEQAQKFINEAMKIIKHYNKTFKTNKDEENSNLIEEFIAY